MVLLEFSMSPLGKGESVGKYVARSLDIIDKSGVAYRLNPMGTVLEGEWEQVFSVVQQCYERMKKDCKRISCTIMLDSKRISCISKSPWPVLRAGGPENSAGDLK